MRATLRNVALIVLPLGVPATVADVLRAVRDDRWPFALTGEWAGSRAIVGSEPARHVEGRDALAVLDGRNRQGEHVGGGWFGYLGFPLGAAIETLPPPPPRPHPLPDASMAFYDHVFRQDGDGAWWFEALDDSARPRLDAVRARLDGAQSRSYHLTDLHARHTGRHLAAVEACVERIAAGELARANITLRLEGTFGGSAADAYLAAAAQLTPGHGAFLDHGDHQILSFSAEQFLRRRGDRVTISPTDGTTTDATPDGAADRGPRCAEPHPGLWHPEADGTARVPDHVTDADIVRAAFPPASVAGAPKVQALKVIAALEGTQREVHTGAIGFASPHAGLQLNVAIRTLEISHGHAWMGCGGGIVADSRPRAELDVALGSARPIAKALGARVVAAGARAARTRLDPWPRRPDPSKGLLETIAVSDHSLVDAEAHLARLTASAAVVYGLAVDLPAPDPQIGQGRIRIRVTPDGTVAVSQHEEIPDPAPVALEPRALAGGLGRHKWLDRTGEPHHLVVDLDGTVLETATANVWALIGGTLVTPPDDGRILPGVTRARLLAAHHETRETPLSLDDLERAEAIVLTSSIRLVTPAGLERGPTDRSVELARTLRNDPAISMKTGSYIRRIAL